jgi:chitinase
MFHRYALTLCILLLSLLFISVICPAGDLPWITMYLPSYYQDDRGALIVHLDDDDFKKITHLSHHGPYVNKDGSFNYKPTRYAERKGEKAVEIAHGHNIPILLCIVSWKEYLITIKNETSRTNLVKNTVHLMDRLGYDGIDVDLEPVIHPGMPEIADKNPDYILFIKQLSDSLRVRKSALLGRTPLLTTAVNGVAGAALVEIYTLYDQINLMTYDMSQPWPGWPVWHDAAITNAGFPFPDVGDLHSPSVIEDVEKCRHVGIPAGKLGIGVSADAFQWKGGAGTSTGGATEPLQQWSIAPKWTRFAYKEMLEHHFKSDFYRWDDIAKMSYLSIDREGSADDEFWSYNDVRSCFDKMRFVQNQQLGGVIIWELGSGYLANTSNGEHLPQLDALYRTKMGWQGPRVYTLIIENGSGAGSYESGTIVKIKAKAPSDGQIFQTWSGDTKIITDIHSAITTITMPDSMVTVTAIFQDN